MSLVPAFEIDVWNAWILMVWLLLPLALLSLFVKIPETEKGKSSTVSSKTERNACLVFHIMVFLAIIYSVFLPLKLGATWFYVGLTVYLLGLAVYVLVLVSFATNPLDREPVTKGLYRYSRHPMYITSFIALIGVGVASASWLVLLLSVLYIVFTVIAVPAEERFLVQQYGHAYREYMNRTPRWIGIPKSGEK
jgi:protein-S-isoprenylcysteine O-methyltransferase Ste14